MYERNSSALTYLDLQKVLSGKAAKLFFGSATPCASPPPRPSIFSDYSFRAHHLVNQDDRHLLAQAMASDFSAAWQCLSKITIVFLLRIKLHALIRLGVSLPS
jgi:hypothetical protein